MQWSRDNYAKRGASNLLIFLNAAQCMQSGRYDSVFVQWSALNRLWLFPAPDATIDINSLLHVNFDYRGVTINRKDRKQLHDLLSFLNHDFHNILQLIDFCCILETMSKQIGCDVYFINGLVPWTRELADEMVHDDLSTFLSAYTKEILDFDQRDDLEILGFLDVLRQKFRSLSQNLWINLFDSMQSLCLDKGPLGHHPGIQSHAVMAEKIIAFFKDKSRKYHA